MNHPSASPGATTSRIHSGYSCQIGKIASNAGMEAPIKECPYSYPLGDAPGSECKQYVCEWHLYWGKELRVATAFAIIWFLLREDHNIWLTDTDHPHFVYIWAVGTMIGKACFAPSMQSSILMPLGFLQLSQVWRQTWGVECLDVSRSLSFRQRWGWGHWL